MKSKRKNRPERHVVREGENFDAGICPESYRDTPSVAADWLTLPHSIRYAVCLRDAQMRAFLPIEQDRLAGRPKRAPDGHWALSEIEAKIYRRRLQGRSVAKLEQQAADLRPKLEAEVSEFQNLLDSCRYFDAHAAAQGLSLGDWVAGCVQMEKAFRHDFFDGFLMCCDRMGHEPLVILAQVMNQNRAA